MTIKRSWLVLKCPGCNASAVATEIWDDNEGKKVEHDDLKKGWLVRADVLDAMTIMVPAVGESKDNATNKDPIDVIAKKLARKYKEYGLTVTRHDVTEHNPSVGNGNDDPDDAAEPLNGWG